MSIAQTRVSQSFPEIDPNLRIGEIESDADPIKRLLGCRIAWHEESELLVPLTGSGNFFLAETFYFWSYSFHGSRTEISRFFDMIP